MASTSTSLQRPASASDTVEAEPQSVTVRARAARRASRAWMFTLAVVASYVAVGVFAYWPVLPGSADRLYGYPTPDPGLSVWYLAWIAHAVAHLQDPLFSNAMLVPAGVNLAQNTSVPVLALLLAPVTLTAGAIASTNLLMVLAMPVSASAAFVVLRKWGAWGPAAALGGLIYGFSPYMVGQGLNHLSLVFLPLPPFIAQALVAVMQRRGPPFILGLWLGLLAAGQFLLSPEVLTVVGVLAFLAIVFVMVSQRLEPLEVAKTLLVPICTAIGLAAILVGYAAWMMLSGPQHFTGAVWGGQIFHNDLLSFVVPGPLQAVAPGLRAEGARLLVQHPEETGGYIGVPLLLVAALLALRSRRRARMQLSAFLMGVSVLLSLGPHLAIDGHLTKIPLPELYFAKLPLFNNIVASRISFEMDACLAALVAFGLDDLRRSATAAPRGRSALLTRPEVALAAIAAVLLVTQLPAWPYPSHAAPSLPAAVCRAVPGGDPVALTYPYADADNSDALVWQAEDSFRFRLLEGYALHPDAKGHATDWPNPMPDPTLQQLLAAGNPLTAYGGAPKLSRRLVTTARGVLKKYDVRLIIVERSVRNSPEVVEVFTQAIGRPELATPGYVVWATNGRSL